MSSYEKGDQVIAIRDISGAIFTNVRKGEKGVVTDVRGWTSNKYDVTFEDGTRLESLDEDDIRPA